MPRMLALTLLLALATLAGPAHAQDARSDHVTHVDISEYPERSAKLTRVDASRYPEVTVYVRVTDAAGRPVAGLVPGDFAVTEEGRAVSIERFADGASETFSAVLVVDRSGSMYDAGKLAGAKEAAAAFAAHMRSGDRAALVVFGDAPSLLAPLTGDPQELRSALRPVRPEGSTALYDALIAGVRQLEFAPGRRVLVLLTDGRDMISAGDPRPASRATIDEAIRAANAAQVPVLAIGLGERGAPGRDGIDEDVLRRIATETGGSYAYAADAAALADLYGALAS
jgi:Ca-activated chloride channel family protein